MSSGGEPPTLPGISPRGDSASRAGYRRVAVFGLGIVLIGTAVWAVARHRETFDSAWASASSAPWWLVSAALLLPLVNLAIISGVFWILTGRYGRVAFGEMIALITSAWLFNTLPLRPGMFGRVAYHRAVNGIAVGDSVRVIVASMACAGVSIFGIVLAVGSGIALGVNGPALLGAALVPVVAFLVAGTLLRSRNHGSPVWRWSVAAGLRSLDVLIWILRYHVTFAIVGFPISWTVATGVSLTSQIAMLMPVQLGLREWVVGASSSFLASGPDLVAQATPGIIADLFNRGVELAIGLPLGLLATLWLAGRWRAIRRQGSDSTERTPGLSV